MPAPVDVDRDKALDFTKGVLVLFMVLYHWINYFVGIGGPIFTYLKFIPPSFIFIAGFLIAHVYPAKYGVNDIRVYKRLIVRGLKLLALFTLLNVIAIYSPKSYKAAMPGIDGFFRDAATIYGLGSTKAAFGVLIPISYLMLLSAGIFLAGRAYKYIVHLVCAALFLCVSFLDQHGLSSSNLSLMAAGIFGMVLGSYPFERVSKWVDHTYTVLCLNICYIVVISFREVYDLLQAIGVCLSVSLIYLMGIHSEDRGGIRSQIVLLGQYSLFGYIAQIALLQLLHRGLPYLMLNKWALWTISFFGAFTVTIMTVKMMHWIRSKSHSVDWLYKMAFC